MIVFTTDNGGPANGFDFNYANNYPLRGVKASLWEGMISNQLFLSHSLCSQTYTFLENICQFKQFVTDGLNATDNRLQERLCKKHQTSISA